MTGETASAFNCPNCGAAVAGEDLSCRYCGSAISTRVCRHCFGAISVGMKHCPHCGKEAEPGGPEKNPSGPCPRCGITLAAIAVGRYALKSCSKCGGLWVDRKSFQDICTDEEAHEAVLQFRSESENGAAPPGQKPQRAYIPCPACGKLMNHKNFSGCSGVVLDWCRDHGSWFDRGELQRIVSFIREGGLQKAREREHLRLKEQKDQLRMQELRMSALDRRIDSSLAAESPKTRDSLLQFLFKMYV